MIYIIKVWQGLYLSSAVSLRKGCYGYHEIVRWQGNAGGIVIHNVLEIVEEDMCQWRDRTKYVYKIYIIIH